MKTIVKGVFWFVWVVIVYALFSLVFGYVDAYRIHIGMQSTVVADQILLNSQKTLMVVFEFVVVIVGIVLAVLPVRCMFWKRIQEFLNS